MKFKTLVQRCFGTVGLRLSRNRSSWDYFFIAVKALGLAPKHIIDVGANHGNWTRVALKYFPESYYTLIEPQDWLKVHVRDLLDRRDKKIRWIGAGVSDQPGILPFTIQDVHQGSTFVVPARTKQTAGIRQIDVPLTTLNEIVRKGSVPNPELVKIDAEGFDLKVIAGASELLGKTDIFLLEATIRNLSLENTIENVLATMSRAGYHLIDIPSVNRSPRYGLGWLCDLAFLRNDSRLMQDVLSYD